MNLKQQIILKYLNGESQRKIQKDLHTSRNTIRSYVNEYNFKKEKLISNNSLLNKNEIIEDIISEPTYNSSNRVRRKISDECIEIIKQCLIENKQKRATGRSKQQLKATDIYELLINKEFDISYPSVSNIVRSLKDTLNEAYIKQEYSLGNICEFDWGEVKLNINGNGFKKYQIAVFTSAFGNYRFAVLFETQDTIAFQQSHALFFEHIGGIYNTMVYDNMKVAVSRFVGHNEKEPTKGLLTLSTYYGFNFRFFNIRSGNEKGHVERSVEYVRSFGLFDWNIKLEHYLNTLHKKSGALENSTAMLNLDTHIKNIYNKYFTLNPKDFLDLYEIILEKGLENVQNAIKELEKVSPLDISSDKVKLICNKQIVENNIDISKDAIAKASTELLIQYKSLLPTSNIQFIRQEVMI